LGGGWGGGVFLTRQRVEGKGTGQVLIRVDRGSSVVSWKKKKLEKPSGDFSAVRDEKKIVRAGELQERSQASERQARLSGGRWAYLEDRRS